MRKVSLILLALLMVTGFVAAQEEMSYPEVTVSGSVSAGWGFGDGAAESLRERGEVKVTAQVDAINTAVVNMRSDGGAAPAVRDANLTTNLGAAFGLEGQSLLVQVGRYENDAFLGPITGIEFENVADIGTRTNQFQLDYWYGEMVKFRGIAQPGLGDAMNGFVGVNVNVEPVMVELFYSDFGSPGLFGSVDDVLADVAGNGNGEVDGTEAVPAKGTDEGFVGFGVQGGYPVSEDITVSGSAEFAYSMFYESFVLGVGASVSALDIATLGVSFDGHGEVDKAGDLDFATAAEASFVNRMGIDLNVEPVPFAGFDLAVVLGLQSTSDTDFVPFGYEETLQYLEPSVYLKAGAATYRLGYAFYNNDATDAEADGGAAYNDYNAMGFIAGQESGFAFFNASISF